MADRIVIENPAPLQPKNFPYRVLPFSFADLQQYADLSPVVATSDPAPEPEQENRYE